jgi:hypothetical protein
VSINLRGSNLGEVRRAASESRAAKATARDNTVGEQWDGVSSAPFLKEKEIPE